MRKKCTKYTQIIFRQKIIPKSVTTLKCQTSRILRSFIVDLDARSIVGVKTCKMLNLVQKIPVPKVHEVQLQKMMARKIPKDICKRYTYVFKDLGCMPGEHTFKVDPNIQRFIHPRKVTLALKVSGRK